ncbi:CvpA family protein [Lachnoclostridium sp. An181]|uniref:CvpA family protein n=1 Tax=Lachnoclostridium sp. An181 TaxID=1965575 RepID=UPI000B38FCE0|nr:CvpA family protein [Lachnoclostridium sp. An181]OUP49181.1 hypothetical protein B5F18_08745 [Lachnoclostridium sp. An181]
MNNWLLIAVGILFLICVIVGYIRGFIKIIVSVAATAATIVLVVLATPYVSKALHTLTPIDDMIQEKCESIFVSEAKQTGNEMLRQKFKELTGTDLPGDVDLSKIDLSKYGLTDEKLKELAKTVEIPREEQVKAIQSADLPEVFKDGLRANNNEEVYKELGVDNFVDYVSAYLAKVVLDIIAFVITFILISIIIRMILFIAGIISDLPVIHGLNRVAGGALGIAIWLVIVWTAFLVITLGYNFQWGKDCMTMIQDNSILQFLYEHNYIMDMLMKFR